MRDLIENNSGLGEKRVGGKEIQTRKARKESGGKNKESAFKTVCGALCRKR